MPEGREPSRASTLSPNEIPIDDDHPFQGIPTTYSDAARKVVAFRTEQVVVFRRNRWSPSTGIAGRLRAENAPSGPGRVVAVGLGGRTPAASRSRRVAQRAEPWTSGL